MKLLALDISTNSGIAFFEGPVLKDIFNIKCKVIGDENSSNYPFNYLNMARTIANEVSKAIDRIMPDFIIIEETNLASNRYHQKQLEFIHCCVSQVLEQKKQKSRINVVYVSTSTWRPALGIVMDKGQRLNNKDILKERDKQKEEIRLKIYETNKHILEKRCEGVTSKRERNKLKTVFEKEIKKQVLSEMRSFRTKTSKVTLKHLAVNYVNKRFNLNLKVKDNDLADAICLASFFLKKIGVL